LFLCYDPTPEGLDAFDLQNLPRIVMQKWYLGNFLNRKLNYGRWMNWIYNATIGFPILFGLYYSKRFIRNLMVKRRERSITEKRESLLPSRNIFSTPLVNTWDDIKRRWRNLFIKTYGGGIARRWLQEYRKSDYETKLKEFFSKNSHGSVDRGSSIRQEQ
jgi:hypothetical protein